MKVSRDPTSCSSSSSSARVILPARYAGYKSHREYRLPFPSLPPPRIDLGESERITEFPQLREPIDKESSQEKGPAESRGNTFSTFSPPPPLILFSALVQPSIYVLYRHRGNMIAMSKTRKRIERRRREEGGGDGIIDETRDR